MFTLYSYDSIIKLPTNYSIRLFELLTSWVNIIIKGENTPAFPDISTDPDEIVLAIDYLRDFFDCNESTRAPVTLCATSLRSIWALSTSIRT